MRKVKTVVAAALPALLLAACGSPGAATAENAAADAEAEADAPDNSGAADPGQANGLIENGADPGPPPDAVSHPDGYLPDAAEPPAPESTTESPPGAKAPAATEDDYIRNKQAGG